MGAPYPPADDARQRADEILARDEFQPPEQSWLDRGFDWIDGMISSFLQSLLSGGVSSVFVWVVLGVLVAIVLVVVLRVSRTVRAVPAVAIAEAPARTRSPRDWQAEADRLERLGRRKEGLQCRYRALVAELVQRDRQRDIPGRTTGEYRAEVGERAPSVAAPFAGASEIFDRAWYGNRPTGSAETERFRELVDDVLVEVGR